MDTELKDTKVAIGNQMSLTIKEDRGTSVTHSPKGTHTEVSSKTETLFHWKLFGIVSKIGAEDINSDNFDVKGQELYDVVFTSHGYRIGHFAGFKTRDSAIENAMSFASRNGINVDGYKP